MAEPAERSKNLGGGRGGNSNTWSFDKTGFASNSAKNWTSWTESKTVPGTFWGGNCPPVPPALIFENEEQNYVEDELDNSSPEVNNAIHQLFEVDPIERNPKWSEVF